MENIHIIATIIGFIASAITISSYQRKESRNIFFTHIFSSSLWATHFLLIDGLSGALMNAGNVVKSIATVYLPERFLKAFAIAYILFLWVMFTTVIYDTPIDLLPIISTTIAVPLMIFRDNRYIVARVSAFGAICWLIYGAIQGSIPAMITDSFTLASIIIGMLRHEKKPFRLLRLKA